MMFWVLIVLAALPLVMALAVVVILRRGVHHRLHERRQAMQGADTPITVATDTAAWGVAPADGAAFTAAGGDAVATGSPQADGGDFGGGGASGDWGSADSGSSGDTGSGGDGGGDGGGGGGGD